MAPFISGTDAAESSRFVAEEENIDERAQVIVRTIEEKVLSFIIHYRDFYSEYSKLNNAVQGSENIQNELKSLRMATDTLTSIKNIFEKELSGFVRYREVLKMEEREIELYEGALKDLRNMLYDLDAYIKNLKLITAWVSGNDPAATTEGIKAGIKRALDLLQKEYEKFTAEDGDLIRILRAYKTIAGHN